MAGIVCTVSTLHQKFTDYASINAIQRLHHLVLSFVGWAV